MPTPTTTWPILESNVEVAAIVVRQAFSRDECASLVEFLINQELMFVDGDDEIMVWS